MRNENTPNDTDHRPAVGGPVERPVMQHSPGPWKFNNDPGEARTISDARGISLMGDEQYYPWAPSEEADWRLIAAAPELLAALRDLVDVMTGRMEGETVALHNALAALLKADGAA